MVQACQVVLMGTRDRGPLLQRESPVASGPVCSLVSLGKRYRRSGPHPPAEGWSYWQSSLYLRSKEADVESGVKVTVSSQYF